MSQNIENDKETLILRLKISSWTSKIGDTNIGVKLVSKVTYLIFVTVASLTRWGSEKNTGNGTAVIPCISCVDLKLMYRAMDRLRDSMIKPFFLFKLNQLFG